MNDFTKDELKHIHYSLTEYGNFESSPVEMLGEKIQSMIDNYQPQQEIHSCYTGIAIGDDFFCEKQSLDKDDLLPAIHALANQCYGIIRESGVYALKLKLVKMK